MSWTASFLTVLFGVIAFFVGNRESGLNQMKHETEKRGADKQIASLNVKAASLEADAENARKEIAVAQAQAAQANEKAEAERLARAQLEVSLLPRTVVSTGKARRELGLFAGTNIVIEFEPANFEAQRLAEQLQSVLGMSRWNVVLSPTRSHLLPGIIIFTKKQADPTLQEKVIDAATLLSCQLSDSGIHTNPFFIHLAPVPPSPLFNSTGNAILVRIGEKPRPYLEDKMLEETYRHMDAADADMLRKVYRDLNEALTDTAPIIAHFQDGTRERIVQKYAPKPPGPDQ